MSFIDISIVVLFLLITLYIGLRSGKNISTFKDYAIGNRKFSDFAIFCTLAASGIGSSSTMGCVGKTYSVGIAQIIVQLGTPMAFLIMSLCLVTRIENYYGCCTLGDMFFKAYGKPGQLLAGIAGFLHEAVCSCMQFMAMGTVLNILTGVPYTYCLLISAGIIFIYTGKGGVRAVTFTDIFQFIILIVAIPLVLIILLKQIGGVQALFDKLPVSHKTITGDTLHRYLFLAFPFILPTLSPIYMQRFLMTKNRYQSSNVCSRVIWIYLLVAFLSVGLGLCARVLLPHLAKADNAMIALMSQCLPVGIYGFVVAGILAVLMSTVDSRLNSGSIMLVNDILIPCLGREVSDRTKLLMSRLSAWGMGLLALILANYSTNIFEMKVITKMTWLPVLLMPLYFLLFNRKISVKGLLFSVLVGVSLCLFWDAHIKPTTKIDGLFPGFFANSLMVILFYFLGGRKRVFSKEQLKQKESLIVSDNSTKFFDEKAFVAKNNVFLGLFLIFIQIMPLIFDQVSIDTTRMTLVLINGALAVMLIFSPAFECFKRRESFTHFKWLTLLLCLPITCLYLLFTSEVNGIHLITLGMSLLTMVLMAGEKYRNKVLLGCLNLMLFTYMVLLMGHKAILFPETFHGGYAFYLLGFVMLMLLLRSNMQTLTREKELAVAQERYKVAKSVSHDLMTPLMVLEIILNKDLDKITSKERKLLQMSLKEMVGIVDSIVPQSQNPEDLPLIILNTCIETCLQKQQFLHKNLNILLKNEATIEAYVDPSLWERIFNNLFQMIARLASSFRGTPIVIQIYKDEATGSGLVKLSHSKISQEALQKVFDQNGILSDELGLGTSFLEMQGMLSHWHANVQILTGSNGAETTLQFLFPDPELLIKERA